MEFKCNFAKPEEMGEYLSAIANTAALHRKEKGYLVWGVDDLTHQVVGTTFKPRQAKKGNEELENWLWSGYSSPGSISASTSSRTTVSRW